MQMYSISWCFWTLLSLIVIRTPWGTVSVKGGIARKSWHFTQNPNFTYSLKLNTNIYIYKSFVIYELDANIFIFRFFEPFSLNYDQITLGYCFIERWCCQKIMPFYLKCQFCLGPKLKTYIYTFKIEIFSILRVWWQVYFISWCFRPFPPQVWSKHLGVLFQWTVVLPEKACLFT